jgi:hypothetical protein
MTVTVPALLRCLLVEWAYGVLGHRRRGYQVQTVVGVSLGGQAPLALPVVPASV